jgi:chromosome segregation ATPase
MRSTLRQAAVVAAVPPVGFGSLRGGGLTALMLLTVFLPAGCRDGNEKARQEATEAKAAAARLELSLAVAKQENADLKAELKAVKQTRDQLQGQVDQVGQERDQAATLAQQARDTITQLTAQAGTTATLEQQIAELKALVKTQQAVIEELQKAAAVQPAANDTSAEAVEDETLLTEPNGTPEIP